MMTTKAKTTKHKAQGYIARVGLNYIDPLGKPKRVEPGEACDDLPNRSMPWLLSQGMVEKKGD
jgi:hypothetical protein